MQHAWETGEVYTGLGWLGGLRAKEHLEDLGIKGRILLKLNFKKWDWEAWTALISLRIRTGGRRL